MAVQNTPWSISKASVALDCNLRFHYKYHMRKYGTPSKSSAGLIGSAAHVFVEMLLKGFDAQEAYRRACLDAPMTTEERRTLQEFNEPAHRFLTRFRKFCATKNVQDTHLHVEKAVAFRRDGTLCDFFDKTGYWRGKWDVGVEVHSPDGLRILIMDHKTGAPSQDKLDTYAAQLNSYVVSALYAYPELKSAQTVLHWLREEDDQQMFQFGPAYTREQIKEDLIPWFYQYYDNANRRAKETPTATTGWFCTFCEYINSCPAHNQP